MCVCVFCVCLCVCVCVCCRLGTNDAKYHNWGPLHAEFPIDYMSMIEAFKNVSTHPKIYLMVPPPLYQDNRYGMNRE